MGLKINKEQLIGLIKESVIRTLNEDHLRIVDNIDVAVDLIRKQWTSPDDCWWVKIEQRKKDAIAYSKRGGKGRYWTRKSRTDGTDRENHVGYLLVRGHTVDDCVNSLLNGVVRLNPWAAREVGTKVFYSNGNAEAIKTVCNIFFARAYITINRRSISMAVNKARDDKQTGLFRGREFHHRVGQARDGVDKSGFNWRVIRPYGLIDCDVDNKVAQAELERYLNKNNVDILAKRQSHDGMHYIISSDDGEKLDFSFMFKYNSKNRPNDPNTLFKPDANMILYSAVG